MLINEMRHGRALFRLAFYLPVMLPPIVTAFLWLWLYNADFGLINASLQAVHLPGGFWLESQSTALPALVVDATWGAAGATLLFYLAALQGVPPSLYEAAELHASHPRPPNCHPTSPTTRPT